MLQYLAYQQFCAATVFNGYARKQYFFEVIRIKQFDYVFTICIGFHCNIFGGKCFAARV